jgi:hypothetical protein
MPRNTIKMNEMQTQQLIQSAKALDKSINNVDEVINLLKYVSTSACVVGKRMELNEMPKDCQNIQADEQINIMHDSQFNTATAILFSNAEGMAHLFDQERSLASFLTLNPVEIKEFFSPLSQEICSIGKRMGLNEMPKDCTNIKDDEEVDIMHGSQFRAAIATLFSNADEIASIFHKENSLKGFLSISAADIAAAKNAIAAIEMYTAAYGADSAYNIDDLNVLKADTVHDASSDYIG